MTSVPELRENESERPSPLPPASMVALPDSAPPIDEIFEFMREAERRFTTLRMRIVERTNGAYGTVETTVELWLAHPGRAKVIENHPPRGAAPASYRVWLSDGDRVRTYDSATNVSTNRPHRHVPDELDDRKLPSAARVAPPITELPAESITEAFVHPAGLTRNFRTGRVALVAQARIAGREALLLDVDAPRVTLIETDRPDHSLTVGVDRETGMVTLLEERVGDAVTRRAEVTYLEPDAPVRDADFVIYVPEDATPIF